MSEKVKKYISENWDKCIKYNPNDDGTLIGLPYPYTVPAVGHFDEMYYWDTYFTNIGLIIDGRAEQAKYNVDNMLYLVNQYGFMPNGNRTYYLNRSQPPFLSCMVRDVYEYYKDMVWLFSAYEILKREYEFWQTKRCSDMGLNHYDDDGKLSEDEYRDIAAGCANRTGLNPDIPTHDLVRHYMSNCESGWDMNPRWDYDGYNFAAVDLNSLLFMMENNMGFFADELKNGEAGIWNECAEKRRALMLEKMDNGEGVLLDYNIVTGKQSDVFSAASFYPLFAGLAEKRHAEAMIKNLDRLESEYGILTCEKNDVEGIFQWDYPNGWACLQYIAIVGFDKYGYTEEAKRIAEKYIRLADKVFNETGNLWEKYDVVNGSVVVGCEYETPPMMGWSAGVYLAALNRLSMEEKLYK